MRRYEIWSKSRGYIQRVVESSDESGAIDAFCKSHGYDSAEHAARELQTTVAAFSEDFEVKRQKSCTDLAWEVVNLQGAHARKEWDADTAFNKSNAPYERMGRVQDRLLDCAALAEIMGGRTEESFRRCMLSMIGGNYKLYPDTDALGLGFTMCGMNGGFIFHRSSKEWSLHT